MLRHTSHSLALALILLTSTSSAQDSIPSIPKSVAWSVSAAHYYQMDGSYSEIYEPRNTDGNAYTTIGDNPLYHGATFAKVRADVEFAAGVHLDAELVGEHRGISYGVYAVDEMIVYPRLLLAFDTSFAIAGEPFRAIARVGNFTDVRWGEGLTFYNMDAQGSDIEFGWRWLRVWRKQIGDAAYGIGLGIGDVMDVGVGLLGVPIVDSVTADAQLSYLDYFTSEGNGVSGSLGLQYGSHVRLYAQIENRDPTRLAASDEHHVGMLAGLSGQVETSGLRLTGRLESRRYGAAFNARRINRSVSYRGAGSTIGEHLYPLEVFERPFSQWGVFTDFQGTDVDGLTAQLGLHYELPYGFVLSADIDMNLISPANRESIAFDFFDLGVGWEPSRGSSVMLSYTNRAMNLDHHYPTISMYLDAVVALTMRLGM
jgi:hypothetical protein